MKRSQGASRRAGSVSDRSSSRPDSGRLRSRLALKHGDGIKSGFTVIEMVAAFALMAVVLVLVAKAGFTSMKERGRSLARQTALEHVHNILETARALSWEKLTPEWAATLKLPEDWIYVLPEAQLHVKVEPEKTSPHLKRVTVHLRWLNADGYPVEEQLVGLFAARSAALKEEKE